MSARQDGRQNCIALKSREIVDKIFVQTVKTDHNLKIEIKISNHAWCALIGLHATWAVGVPVFLIVERIHARNQTNCAFCDKSMKLGTLYIHPKKYFRKWSHLRFDLW